MKHMIIFSVFFYCSLCTLVYAQDKNTLATNSYLKAEEYYSAKQYNKALDELSNTEKILGVTNSKILYLKSIILKTQFKAGNGNHQMFQNTLDRFFEVTDKNLYPHEKYMEIVRVQSDLKEFIKSDSLISKNLIENGDLNQIKSYLSKTPQSLYYNQLSEKKSSMQVIQDKIDDERELETRLVEIDKELNEAKGKNFNRRFYGGIAFFGGGAISAAALSEAFVTEDTEMAVLYPIVAGLAGAVAIMGAVSLIGGNPEVKWLKREKDDLLQKKSQMELTIKPFYRPTLLGSNEVGLNFKFSF